MSKGRKMCKYKSLSYVGLFDRMSGNQTITCTNGDLSDLWFQKVNKDTKYCSARLCPHYVSK